MNSTQRWLILLPLLGLTLAGGAGRAAAHPAPDYDPQKVKTSLKIALKAEPFSLKDVRLLNGPFKHAMEMDAKYLLSLEPDRLLHNFRVNAGLPPKGELYGGWESQGVAGHTLGHYLSACAMMFASTGDRRFLDRVNAIVDDLALCQAQRADGYVSAIPDGERIFREVSQGDIRSQGFDLNGGWVPWYTMHKLFAGLLDAYAWTDNATALKVAQRLGDWAIGVTRNLTDAQWQTMLACEHGGMNEALANLYAVTGEKRFLDLALKFHHRAVLDPLEHEEERLAGLHGNTQIPKVIGAAREYELTGQRKFGVIARFFWSAVVHHHTYAMGGHGSGEHFGPPNQLSDRLTPTSAETCNTYNMLKLTKHLFMWDPRPEYADYYERALYNHILASQDPDSGMMCYYVSLAPGGTKAYSTPFDSFWCCVGTGIENHARYGEAIYFHNANSLTVNLYIASQLTWKAKGLTLRQETNFPRENSTQLHFTLEKPTHLALRLRWPSWATQGMTVTVDGEAQRVTGQPGSYVIVDRTWKTGDTVALSLPMTLREEPLPDNLKRVALMWGPLVLSGDLGPEAAAPPTVPVFVAGEKPLAAWVKPSVKAAEFRTADAGRPDDVSLIPFYAMHHRRYSVYWDLYTEAEWRGREAEVRAEEARLARLEARTVDELAIGEMQAERNHHLVGEKSGVGDFNGRKWRHAVDGGGFAFEMKVAPSGPTDLLLTYWGSDGGSRIFDILVDGVTVATQTLEGDAPGRFFEVTHPLPEEVTRGREKVTVRLQAHAGQTAGGLFGCRTVKREGGTGLSVP